MNSPRMLAVYAQYWRINLLTTLEYRANFFIWFIFTFVYHGTAIAALYIVLKTFPSMNGWSFRDMAFLYALWMVGHALNIPLSDGHHKCMGEKSPEGCGACEGAGK